MWVVSDFLGSPIALILMTNLWSEHTGPHYTHSVCADLWLTVCPPIRVSDVSGLVIQRGLGILYSQTRGKYSLIYLSNLPILQSFKCQMSYENLKVKSQERKRGHHEIKQLQLDRKIFIHDREREL